MKHGKKLLAVVVSLAVAVGASAGFAGCTNSSQSPNDQADQTLSAWSQDSPTKQKVENFVKDATTQDSGHFIPVEDRIVTFDLDGTLIAEWPITIVLGSAKYRIENDLSNDTELVNELDYYMNNLHSLPKSQRPNNYYDIENDLTTKAFAKMTPEQTTDKVAEFMQTQHPDFTDLTYSQSFYKPMVQLVEYLQQNQFTVYLVSGSERDVIRGAVRDVLNVSVSQLIGSDINMLPSGASESGQSDSNYVFQPSDSIERVAGFNSVCIKNNKVYAIEREIGQVPVMAFGNTADDFSMLNYAMSNKKYQSCAFILNHDDDQREYIYTDQAEQNKCQQAAQQYGWGYTSMKQEFSQVFVSQDAQKTKDNNSSMHSSLSSAA